MQSLWYYQRRQEGNGHSQVDEGGFPGEDAIEIKSEKQVKINK